MKTNDMFGRRLKAVMKTRGVRASWVADELGVTPNTVTNWRKGRVVPHADTLIALSQLLGEKVDWLLGGEA